MKTNRLLFMLLAMLALMLPACVLDEDDPDADPRDKFIGTWRFDESPLKSNMAFYNVVITKDPGNTSQVLLRNFGNVGNFHSAYGVVAGSIIAVESQTVASVTLSGTGTLTTSSRMTWTYSINDGADLNQFTAIAEKQ